MGEHSSQRARLTLDDIVRMVRDHVEETDEFDFKKTLSLSESKAQRDLMRDVTAFTHQSGGTIIVGVKEQEKNPDHAGDWAGLSEGDAHSLNQQIEGLCSSHIDPAIQGLNVRTERISDTASIVIVTVPAGGGVHYVCNFRGDAPEAWIRIGKTKRAMTPAERMTASSKGQATSNQQALSTTPVTNRPVLNTLVRGRDDLMDWLNRAKGDVLIVGQPGSGKTFAVGSYAARTGGQFVVSENADEIMAEVCDQHPRFLIVDDAHRKLSLLQSLRQMRQDTGAGYRIVATAWRSHRDTVREALSVADDAVFELKLLDRDTMVQIIRDCGVMGPDLLLSQMVTQAEGKPGLASTLSQLVRKGSIQDVYVGEALGKYLDTLLKDEVGDDAMALLAVAALGGDSGISLDAAAQILDITPFRAQDCAFELAFGGVIEDIGQDRISVRPPPLRSYLAKRHFFRAGANIDPSEYLPKYPSLSDAVGVILSVALIGGNVDREKLYHLIEETGSPDLFGGYAHLGKREARRVIDEHPETALRAARALLDTCPEGILPLMLDKATGDDRPLHSSPGHPMRIIQDWCKDPDYSNAIVIGNRDILLTALSKWGPRTGQEKIAAQALAAIFCPRVEFLHPDPGSGRTFTFGSGHLGTTALQHLIDLLPKAKEYFMVRGTDGLKELLDLLHDWVYETPMMGETMNAEQRTLLREGSSILLNYINEAATGHPGIQAQLEECAHELGRELVYEKDVEYETIFPREGDPETWQKAAEQQREAVLHLAAGYSELDPGEAIRKLSRYSKEAYDAGPVWPDYVGDIASYLAEHVSNLAKWSRLSVTEWDNAAFSYPLLARYYATNPTEAGDLLMEALDHPSHRCAAVQVILKRHFAKDTLWEKACSILEDVVGCVYAMVARQEVDEDRVLMLLEHPSGRVAMMVAAALEQAYHCGIPDLYVDRWENALIGYQFSDGRYDSHVGLALRKHPATIAKWLRARAAEDTERYEGGFVQNAKELIPELSEDQKADVIGALQETNSSRLVATRLVGNDPRLFDRLLANPNAAAYQLDVLSSAAGPAWRSFAEIAVRAGFDDATIESACVRREDSWTGPTSQHFLELKKGYRDGLDSSEPRVVAIAQKCMDFCQEESDRELALEKRAEIYGG